MLVYKKNVKILSKKLILCSFSTFIAFTTSSQEQADVPSEVTIEESGMAIVVTQDIDFGNFTFTSSDAGGIVQMSSTTGTIVMNGSDYISEGSSHFGIIDYTIEAGDYVITCDDEAYLDLENDSDLNNRIPIQRVYYEIGNKTRICGQGENPRTYTSNGAPKTIYIAGWIELKPGVDAIPGAYSTANSQGKPITFTFTTI